MRIPDKVHSAFVPGRAFNELVDIVQWLIENAIVSVGPGLESRLLPRGRGVSLSSYGPYFLAVIDGHSADGDNKFKYTWTEVVKESGGYSGEFIDRLGGRTGTAENGLYARNIKEHMNSSSGTLGNGVAIANLVGSFELQPCPTGNIVRMWIVMCTDGSVEYWFDDTFEIDGECPE
jgi:hypothetical protein